MVNTRRQVRVAAPPPSKTPRGRNKRKEPEPSSPEESPVKSSSDVSTVTQEHVHARPTKKSKVTPVRGSKRSGRAKGVEIVLQTPPSTRSSPEADPAPLTLTRDRQQQPPKTAGGKTAINEATPKTAAQPQPVTATAAAGGGAGPSGVSPATPPAQWTAPDWFDPSDDTKLQRIRSALARTLSFSAASTSAPALPMCRAEEERALEAFLTERLTQGTGGALYISGVPGTGKTLTATAVCRELLRKGVKCRGSTKPVIAYVNCMSMGGKASDAYLHILEAIYSPPAEDGIRTGDPTASSDAFLQDSRERLAALSQAPDGKGKRGRGAQASSIAGPLVVLLDEVDQLARGGAKGEAVLVDLFKLAMAPGSRLSLVGIANSLDLTEAQLPALRREGLAPHQIRFRAYDEGQIRALLEQRLGGLPGPVVDPAALDLLSKRVARETGDMRRALDWCWRAVKVLSDRYLSLLVEGGDEATALAKCRKVTLREMNEAMVGGGARAQASTAIKGLPRNQQMVLCTAARLLNLLEDEEYAKAAEAAGTEDAEDDLPYADLGIGKKRKKAVAVWRPKVRKDCTGGELLDAYMVLCRQQLLQPLAPAEFYNTLQTLEQLGLLTLTALSGRAGGAGIFAGEWKGRRVALKIHPKDIRQAYEDEDFYKAVLNL